MEARQLVVVAPFTEDCREGAAADEAGGSYPEGPRGTYGLYSAVCVEDSEGQGEYVARHAVEAGGCTWHPVFLCFYLISIYIDS